MFARFLLGKMTSPEIYRRLRTKQPGNVHVWDSVSRHFTGLRFLPGLSQ